LKSSSTHRKGEIMAKKEAPSKATVARARPTKTEAPAKKVPVRTAKTAAPAAAAAEAPAKMERFSLVDLRDDVVSKLPLVSRGTAEKVILASFKSMAEAFLAGKSVNIKDFGRIEIKHRQERIGRNPATGEAITIPAKIVPKFTFAKVLKDAVPAV
jgi:nucleoid DNA-binding protein